MFINQTEVCTFGGVTYFVFIHVCGWEDVDKTHAKALETDRHSSRLRRLNELHGVNFALINGTNLTFSLDGTTSWDDIKLDVMSIMIN